MYMYINEFEGNVYYMVCVFDRRLLSPLPYSLPILTGSLLTGYLVVVISLYKQTDRVFL